jgi:hypothetical protein
MKLYVLVKNFSGINQDVELFRNLKEAGSAFKEYTGFPFNPKYNDPENDFYNEKFSETKIYELDLPDFLEFRRDSNEKR